MYARASARIPVAERGGVRDLKLGEAVERVAGRLAAPATILKESLKGTGEPGDGLRWWRHRAPAVGVVIEAPGGGSGQKRAPGSGVWEGAA